MSIVMPANHTVNLRFGDEDGNSVRSDGCMDFNHGRRSSFTGKMESTIINFETKREGARRFSLGY